MVVRGKRVSWKTSISVVLAAVVLSAAGFAYVLSRPTPVYAHCDSVKGPVVTAAQEALEIGEVKHILPYVQPDAEAELTAAFQQTMEVRKLGGEAQQLAERYFLETAVRLHRTGEGAPYTGLKETTDAGPALSAADQALETGSLDGVYKVINNAVHEGVAKKYQAVVEAREAEAASGTVEAARERVEAELGFEKYVYELHQTALGEAAAAEGGQAQTASQGQSH